MALSIELVRRRSRRTLMVWLMPVAESGRIWVIILLTYPVGLAEFSHIIAGSVETPLLVGDRRAKFP
jgi:formate-nitrite transporter family protein